MKSNLVLVTGLIVTALGVLFMLQGSNTVQWPATSFMIGNRDWVERGLVVVLLGVALLFTARRIRQP